MGGCMAELESKTELGGLPCVPGVPWHRGMYEVALGRQTDRLAAQSLSAQESNGSLESVAAAPASPHVSGNRWRHLSGRQESLRAAQPRMKSGWAEAERGSRADGTRWLAAPRWGVPTAVVLSCPPCGGASPSRLGQGAQLGTAEPPRPCWCPSGWVPHPNGHPDCELQTSHHLRDGRTWEVLSYPAQSLLRFRQRAFCSVSLQTQANSSYFP